MGEIANSEGAGAFADRDAASMERRLFRMMCVSIALAVPLSALVASWRVTTGLLLGGILSLFNHHWLSSSIKAAFDPRVESTKTRIRATRFILRYFLVAGVVFVAYRFHIVSLVATLAGLCAFVVAVLVEAFIQTYFAIIHREEI